MQVDDYNSLCERTRTRGTPSIVSKLVVGCGYVGERLALRWSKRGDVVHVSTRRAERAERFLALGLHPLVMDVTHPCESLPEVDTVVFAVGFDRSSGKQIDEVYVRGLENVLDACPPSVRRFIYVSSTGVYGDADGEWIDEDSECRPNRAGGKACLAAEGRLRNHPVLGDRAIVLRLAGIYGPERLPQVASLRSGEPLRVAADAWLNLIHVDDAVGVIDACVGNRVAPPMTLCVSDGSPVLRGDFYRYLAERLALPAPKFEPPEPGSSRAERARGSKRISNERLVKSLGYQFQHADYRSGLDDIVG